MFARIFIAVLSGLLLGCTAPTAQPAPQQPTSEPTVAPHELADVALRHALNWLHSQQRPDGALGDESPNISATVDAVYGIGLADASWSPNANSLLAALRASAPTYLDEDHSGHAAKVLRALAVVGEDGRDFAGLDVVQRLNEQYDAEHGWSDGLNLFRHALAVEALSRAHQPVPEAALELLSAAQGDDGGWGWRVGGTSPDVDTSAQILISLLAAGLDPEQRVLRAGAAYLLELYRPGEGWPASAREDALVNSNSTALALRALLLGGWVEDELAGEMLHTLLEFQEGDGGFRYSVRFPESRLIATLDAVPTLVAAVAKMPAAFQRDEKAMRAFGIPSQ